MLEMRSSNMNDIVSCVKNLTPNGNKWACLANQLSLVIYLLMTN